MTDKQFLALAAQIIKAAKNDDTDEVYGLIEDALQKAEQAGLDNAAGELHDFGGYEDAVAFLVENNCATDPRK